LPKRKIRFVLHSNRFEHLLAFSKQALFANLSGLKNFCNDIYFFPKEKNSSERIERKGLLGCPYANPRIYPWEATLNPHPMALAVGFLCRRYKKKERKHHCSALVRNHPTVIMKDLKSKL